jgi:hypothetical protein
MKEYRILREIENVRMGPNNRQLLEQKMNELGRDGWVVSSFSVTHVATGAGPVISSNAWYCAVMERDVKPSASR